MQEVRQNAAPGRKGKLTPVIINHYVRLVYRGALFLGMLFLYIMGKVQGKELMLGTLESNPLLLRIIWIVFTVEMACRFFPSRIESPGSQKQFLRNYQKTGETHIEIQENNATMLVLIIWIAFNMVFWGLFQAGIVGEGFMLLLSCAYSVCDMICILFFCPFQSWFLKNKCCSACRIYNWDYAMMFTPLVFIWNRYTWSLLVLSIGLLLRWEITFYLHPERFSEKTNAYLRCANCTEKLCTHKKQLHTLWKSIAQFSAERARALRK